MGGMTATTTGLALLLAAGMAWADGVPGREENRCLSPIALNPTLKNAALANAAAWSASGNVTAMRVRVI